MRLAYCSNLAILLAMACVAVTSDATEPNPIESKRFFPTALARFEIVLGRLQLSPEYFRIGAAHERTTLADGRERARSLSISTLRGKPSLQFRDQGGDEEVQLSFKADRQVDISLTSGRESDQHKLTYHQPADGPISVHVEFSDGRQTLDFQSRSIWHLAINEPQFVDAYLQPCLWRLDPTWQIARTVEDARQLINNPLQPNDAMQINRLIAQLDAELATERYAAWSQLELLGIAAEHPLRRSLTTELSIQQQTSVRRLLNTIQPIGNDTPMRVAIWLSTEFN